MPHTHPTQRTSLSNDLGDMEATFGLDLIAHHNSGMLPSNDSQIDLYHPDSHYDDYQGYPVHDLGITLDGPNYSTDSLFEEHSGVTQHPNSVHLTPSSPRSVSPGTVARHTRSGRLVKNTASPLSPTKDTNSRVSKSPRPRKPRTGKSDKSKGAPRIGGPLSELTKDSDVPVKDIEAWVNRSAEARVEESRLRKGHIARPMNSFMLYRSAYADRTKAWCKQNNHQIVSSVAGESWPLEPDEIREMFNEYSKIERENHAIAFPNYKFSPSKANSRKRDDDGEDDGFSLGDPDADYAPSRRVKQQRSAPQDQTYQEYMYQAGNPYMGDQYIYAPNDAQYQPRYGGEVQARPLPAAAYRQAEVYDSHYQHQGQSNGYASNPYPAAMDMQHMRAIGSPVSGYGATPPVGLPAGYQSGHQISRNQTPVSYQGYPTHQGGLHSSGQMDQYSYPPPAAEPSHFNTAYHVDDGLDLNAPGFLDRFAMDPLLMASTEPDPIYPHLVDHGYYANS